MIPAPILTSGSAEDSSVRVVHVVDSLGAGGMENGIANLANRLASHGVDSHVVALSHRGEFAERMPKPGQVTALGKGPGFDWRWSRTLYREILVLRPDIVHTHNLGPLIYAGLASLHPKFPPILHGEHAELDASEQAPRRLNLRRALYQRCAALHTVSESLSIHLRSHGLRHRQLIAIPNGVDTERFQPATALADLRRQLGLPAPDEGFVFGMVARFGPFKRHKLLVEAFNLLANVHESVWLVLVGDGGPEATTVREQVAASPHASRILLPGFQANPAPWHQSFDLLVLPSINEGMSNALLEGMTCGTPVLAQASCGCSELIEDGITGFLMDCQNAQDLATSLSPFLSNPSGDWRRAGMRARQRVMETFSLDSMAAAYLSLYQSIAYPRKRRA